MTTYKTINTENRVIKGINAEIKTIEKTIETATSTEPLVVNYYEVRLNGYLAGSHEVRESQLKWILDEKNIEGQLWANSQSFEY